MSVSNHRPSTTTVKCRKLKMEDKGKFFIHRVARLKNFLPKDVTEAKNSGKELMHTWTARIAPSFNTPNPN